MAWSLCTWPGLAIGQSVILRAHGHTAAHGSTQQHTAQQHTGCMYRTLTGVNLPTCRPANARNAQQGAEGQWPNVVCYMGSREGNGGADSNERKLQVEGGGH